MADYNSRDTSAPSNSGLASDSVGGTVNPPSQQTTFDQNSSSTTGPSASYGSNVDQNFGETGEKKGFMSKLKDKLMPDGPGETQTSDISARDAASHVHHASHGGQDVRHAQANTDLNRE